MSRSNPDYNSSKSTLSVSVLVITYNHEKYIAQTINSILAQNCSFRVEIVIGEDCSRDSTAATVQSYKERYPDIITVITSEANVGMLNNLIRTLNACKGKYIAICEGDDYWTDPDKLQKQVEFLEANPEYGIISSDISLIDKNGLQISDNRIITHQREMYKPEVSIFDLIECNVVNTPTVCIRSSVIMPLMELIATENLWYVYDYWFWLQIAVNHKIRVSNRKTAAYRVDNQGISRQEGFLLKRIPYTLYDIIMELLSRGRTCSEKEQRIIAGCIFPLIKNRNIGFRRRTNLVGVLLKNPNLIWRYLKQSK